MTQDFIEQVEEQPLSSDDIRKIAGSDVNVVPYSSLAHIKTLNHLLGPSGAVILYRWKPDFGHWVAVTQNPYGTVSYFDSYGKGVDHWLLEQKPGMAERVGQTYPYLSRLLEQAIEMGRKVDVNRRALQADGSNIADCGRYAALRVLFSDISNDQFIDMITDPKGSGSIADRNVSLMTSLLTRLPLK